MSIVEGKVALVTGASRGIGLSIVNQLVEQGALLAINSSSKQNLEVVQKDLMKKGVEVLLCPGNLADPNLPKSIIEKVIEHYGKLDILINNAGVSSEHRTLEETSIEDWDIVMNVNARAPFLLCREAIPYLRESDFATIINITSTLATKGYINSGAYTASKHALRGMTKVLAKEVFSDDIRVHIVAPGGVDTVMLDKSSPKFAGRQLSTPDEMANVVKFLLNQRGGAMVIDEIKTHRCSKEPWQ